MGPQTYKMEIFATTFNGWKPLTIATKLSISDFCKGPAYATRLHNFFGNIGELRQKKFGLVFLIVEILDENVGGNELKKPIKLRMQKSAFYF